MTQWHIKGKRTMTGAIRDSIGRCDKKLAWKGGDASETKVSGSERRKSTRGMGGTTKVKQRAADRASVAIPGQKKAVQAKILAVTENTANRLFTRRNIITKGAIIKITIDGKEARARVTSRPGQHGVVQAVMLENSAEEKPKKHASESKEKAMESSQEKAKAAPEAKPEKEAKDGKHAKKH